MRMESGFEFHDRVSEPGLMPARMREPDWDDPVSVDDLKSFLTRMLLPTVWERIGRVCEPVDGGVHPGLLQALIADDLIDMVSWAGDLLFDVALANERHGVEDRRDWEDCAARRFGRADWRELVDAHPGLPLVCEMVDRVLDSGHAEMIRLDGMPVDILLTFVDGRVEAHPLFV
ncbi:hypothetical protein [Bifidobacterium sp. SO1]|uniref:hypothetical protein n=1 Tax=Bifidobacterium sp. SO1 TaxID=2809029 RepID=UPI001BDC37C1|nr:hypothetical protein [Bifidobacterium sp. SO1]MBT1161748.1 hypothetical protein [Bifidobacterium sp. SO1]